ncbi:MAG TPA: 50S ribosomal protein L10 [Phycisphaerae bacterium]|nr:50S ribosomal protein L10 [Phycisphaerae bacterium]
MSRVIKEKIVERYQGRFRDASTVAVVSTQGTDVRRMTSFRGALRSRGIRAMQVQNRLCRRALGSTNLEALKDLLRGPSTLVWGGDNIVEIAKVLVGESKTLKTLDIRGGVSEGRVLTKADLESFARLPSREELIGQIIGRILGQARRVAALVTASGGRLAAQVREVEKKSPPPEPAAAEPVRADGEPAAAETKEAPKAEGAK